MNKGISVALKAEAAKRAFKKLKESADTKTKFTLPRKPFRLIEKARSKKRPIKKVKRPTK